MGNAYFCVVLLLELCITIFQLDRDGFKQPSASQLCPKGLANGSWHTSNMTSGGRGASDGWRVTVQAPGQGMEVTQYVWVWIQTANVCSETGLDTSHNL